MRAVETKYACYAAFITAFSNLDDSVYNVLCLDVL